MAFDIPNDSFLLDRARQDAQQATGIVLERDNTSGVTLAIPAAIMSKIKDDYQALLAALENPSSQVRIHALFVLRDEWPESHELVKRSLEIAFQDAESIVRGVALFVLYHFHGWINDPNRELRNIVLPNLDGDDAQTAEVVKESSEDSYLACMEIRHDWEQLIGSRVNDMLRCRELVESDLHNPNSDIRFVALAMMCAEWKPTLMAATVAEEYLNDPEIRIRKMSIGVIRKYYSGTNNRRIETLLIELVVDQSNANDLRLLAYQALLSVSGRTSKAWRLYSISPDEFVPSRDIDWGLIRTMQAHC